MWVCYMLIATEINKWYRNVYILYSNVKILYIQHVYTLEFRTSTSGMVTHYTGWGCQSLTPRKYTVLSENFALNLRDIFQEHYPGIKRDLLVISSKIIDYKNKEKLEELLNRWPDHYTTPKNVQHIKVTFHRSVSTKHHSSKR